MYQKVPVIQNSSPLAGYQFFGEVNVAAQDGALTVTLRDMTGAALFERRLEPRA